MGLKTWKFKLSDKVISVKAKKDDAERFGMRVRDVLAVPSMVRELYGVIGVDEHASTMRTLFGPSGVPLADPDRYKADVQDFINEIPTYFDAENMERWSTRAADLITRHTPVKDTRRTPEQEEEHGEAGKRFQAEQEAKRQAAVREASLVAAAKRLGLDFTAEEWREFEAGAHEDPETSQVLQNVLNEAASPAPQSTTAGDVTVRLNPERNGVEVVFPGKPERSTIDSLKAHGFRWSPRGKLWYAKQSDTRIAFAHSLQGKEVAA